VMSCFAAFVISFPAALISRIKFLLIGLAGIQALNTLRLVLIAIFYTGKRTAIDHHDLFNYALYLILAISVYTWTNHYAHHPAKKKL
jgi:exosortase/archaeosortase family protein